MAIRRFTADMPDLDTFVAWESMTTIQRDVLRTAVQERKNIIVSGATGSGKTTLLNALAATIPDDQRLVTIEDAAELQFPGHVVRLEATPANIEGEGQISLADLVRTALRLRPDRIIVGEVRGPEALEMIAAMNTSHDGSLSTVHANGPPTTPCGGSRHWRCPAVVRGSRRCAASCGQRSISLSTLPGAARRAKSRPSPPSIPQDVGRSTTQVITSAPECSVEVFDVLAPGLRDGVHGEEPNDPRP